MFARVKRSVQNGKTYEYLQIVETFRDNGRVRQRIVGTIGKLDELQSGGKIDGLMTSLAKFSDHAAVITEHKNGETDVVSTRKIGPHLVFDRLWKNLGIGNCIGASIRDRKHQFDVEAALYMTVLHRLMDPGSDRAAEKWREEHDFPDAVQQLELHHLYRAMGLIGEALPKEEQKGRTPFAPRCVKDEIEERLFVRRKDLFTEAAVVFFDTTSIYFEGRGGQEIGRHGYSKDHRPDLAQMVVGLVLDSGGRPICCEMWPGNTTDVKSLLPIVDRLQQRFSIKEITIVADRGMIDKDVMTEIEKRDLGYILGVRMRRDKMVRDKVLTDTTPFIEIVRPRKCSKDPSPLKVKEVEIDDTRYIVCVNEEQARKDAADRAAIVEGLKKVLKQGDKSLVGNKGFRKYIKADGAHFEIDSDKIESEARFDGHWVLTTNLDDTAEDVARTYKMLWMVETLFRTMKSILETRPIFHKRDDTIRGHVFCSFLALLMMRELQEKMDDQGHCCVEWADVIADLDTLTETEIKTANGLHFVLRSECRGWTGKIFQSVGVAMPPTLRQVSS